MFDDCLRNAMASCEWCEYTMWWNNCCDCVANSIRACHGRYSGGWPNNPFGWGGPAPSKRGTPRLPPYTMSP